MSRKILFISCLTFMIFGNISARESNLWLSYGQSKFMYSPGIEANFPVYKNFGIQLGVSCYFQAYEEYQVSKLTDTTPFNFHNLNIGISRNFLTKGHHRLGGTIGFKLYYGPDYKLLHYYEEGGYPIYFDCTHVRPSYGIDLGIFYSFKRLSFLIKFDTAREYFRVGMGYAFNN